MVFYKVNNESKNHRVVESLGKYLSLHSYNTSSSVYKNASPQRLKPLKQILDFLYIVLILL